MDRDPLFTEQILPWAKSFARQAGDSELAPTHIFLGALKVPEARDFLVALVRHARSPALGSGDIEELTAKASALDAPLAVTDALNLTDPLREAVARVHASRNGVIDAKALLAELVGVPEREWTAFPDVNRATGPESLPDHSVSRLRTLTDRIEDLRGHLAAQIIGQDQAIEQVCEALFAAEAYRTGSSGAPRTILTFVGPSGVGKTYLAGAVARWLLPGKPQAFLRLDMSNYADPQAFRLLVGFEGSYTGAAPGTLTSHVQDHPDCVVLVDELEKAHPTTVNLFLQILDAGRLEDKNRRTVVDFSRALLIFTTNLGRELYDSPNRSGFFSKGKVSRAMVLDALAAEASESLNAGLSPEFISRLGTGYPVLFQRFQAHDLERLAAQALDVASERLRERLGLDLRVDDPRIPALMVLKFGPEPDARQLKSGVENLILDRFQDLLFEQRERLLGVGGVLENTRVLRLTLADDVWKTLGAAASDAIACLVIDDDPTTVEHCTGAIRDVSFVSADSRDRALEVLRTKPVHAVLVDLHLGEGADSGRFELGLGILDAIRTRFPSLPVFLFSEFPERRQLSSEALERIARAGGGRDFFRKDFAHGETAPDREPVFLTELRHALTGLRSERLLRSFLRSRRVIDFDLRMDRAAPDAGITLTISNATAYSAVTAADRQASFAAADIPRERFADVVGMTEVKRRLQEVVTWFRNPASLKAMGVELPRGILLTGPPGTGKTMLARAVAGEAELPFFAVSATDFFSKWAGESEARIRQLFGQARRYAPSIVFIDEIDAVGGARGDGESAWKEGVLNQLLVCMDGFARDEGPVFVMAATNREDVLDPALTRPGRFDHVVRVEEPDRAARRILLELRCRDVPLAEDVDLDAIADRTAGLSGASLVQIVKEAAIRALRDQSPRVGMAHFEEAVNTVRVGFAHKDRPMSRAEKWATAVHEAGHAVVHLLLFPEIPIAQVTILPRGKALGFVQRIEPEGVYSFTRKEVVNRLQVALAGRLAEELVLGPDLVTSGCSDDLRSATRLAMRAVGEWGMDEQAGLLSHGSNRPSEMVKRVDAWVREAYAACRTLLEKDRTTLLELANGLMERETITTRELAEWGGKLGGGPAQTVASGGSPG